MTERPRFRSQQEIIKPPRLEVITKTTSARRTYFLKYCFPDALHSTFFGGNEAKIPDAISISRGKLDFNRTQIPASKKDLKRLEISADTQTNTLSINEYGIIYLENHGKPQHAKEVFDTFIKMNDASSITQSDPYYMVTSGSSALIREPKKKQQPPIRHLITTKINLNKEIIEKLATANGFNQYLETFKEFYSNPLHQNLYKRETEITDIAGGFCISILAKIGAITSIDTTSKDDPKFPQVFKRALFNASIGFSPVILEKVQPGISEKIDNWPWLNEVAQQSLRMVTTFAS